MERGPGRNQLDFGGDPVQDVDPEFRFLNLDQDADPEICYCPARLISLDVEDISSFRQFIINNCYPKSMYGELHLHILLILLIITKS